MQIALLRPEVDMPSVYRLTVYYRCKCTPDKYLRDEETDEYYSLLHYSRFYFSGFAEGEKYIRELTDPQDAFLPNNSIVRMLVERIPLDKPRSVKPLEWRAYDNAGRLVDQSVYKMTNEQITPAYARHYLGRKLEEIRFQPGDIVEVMDKDEENRPTRVTSRRLSPHRSPPSRCGRRSKRMLKVTMMILTRNVKFFPAISILPDMTATAISLSTAKAMPNPIEYLRLRCRRPTRLSKHWPMKPGNERKISK